MRRSTYMTVAILILALILARPEAAVSQTPPQSLDIRQVALFKNGLGFFVGQIVCPEGQTSFQVALPLSPSHGTFWISCPTDLPLASAVAKQVDCGQAVEATSIPEMLRINAGRRVRLTVGDEQITGVIRHIALPQDSPQPNPYLPGRSSEPSSRRSWEPFQEGGLLVLETETGDLSFSPRAVSRVTFPDGNAEQCLVKQGKRAVLQINLKQPCPGGRLSVSFLGKGVTWAPSYLVDITEAGTARISAKALVLNDACELKGTDIQLVTGFPHLQFADTLSPVALKENLPQFLKALSAGRSERGMPAVTSNVTTQVATYQDATPEPVAKPAYGASETGQVAEDLFLYPAGSLDLGREEVAYIPLFTEIVPCKHIYQWEIPDYVNAEGSYQPRPDRPVAAEEVWHSIRLTNTTRTPWTTAPGETVKSGTILGQDTLRYTPPRAESTLRITRAIGVKAEQREFEVDRKRDAVRMYHGSFDLITVRGDLSVVNLQDKPVDLEIIKHLTGEARVSDPAAKIEKLAVGLQRMNGRQNLTWTLELKSGENKDVSYEYEVYIRR